MPGDRWRAYLRPPPESRGRTPQASPHGPTPPVVVPVVVVVGVLIGVVAVVTGVVIGVVLGVVLGTELASPAELLNPVEPDKPGERPWCWLASKTAGARELHAPIPTDSKATRPILLAYRVARTAAPP